MLRGYFLAPRIHQAGHYTMDIVIIQYETVLKTVQSLLLFKEMGGNAVELLHEKNILRF